jgi:hypothetical protein
MGQRVGPQCSCDAASVLSFATNNGCFTAAVQCHVCGFAQPIDRGFDDAQTARNAATMLDWRERSPCPQPLVSNVSADLPSRGP